MMLTNKCYRHVQELVMLCLNFPEKVLQSSDLLKNVYKELS